MASIQVMIEQISSLLGTKDLNGWETDFVTRISSIPMEKRSTLTLSGKQCDTIESIWKKHFS